MRGPHADALYRRELSDYFIVREPAKTLVIYGFVGEFFCEVFQVLDFLQRKSCSTHCGSGHGKGLFRSREFSCGALFPIDWITQSYAKQRNVLFVYRESSAPRYLLEDYRPRKRLERVLATPQFWRPVPPYERGEGRMSL